MSDARNAKGRRLNIGVTLFIREGQQSLWENGIFQNCYFLLMLLGRSPLVDKIFIVNGGPGNSTNTGDLLNTAPAPVIGLEDAMNELDVVVELSAQLSPDWGRQFRERGGHIVGMRVANDFVIDVERMIFDLPHGMLISGTPYDMIWTLPAFLETNETYYRVGGRAPVRAMQHLWNPTLLEQSIAARTDVTGFAYRPGRERWRVAVLEPNICTVKTGHLPLLLVEQAHRIAPRAIDYLRVYNTSTLRQHAGFISFARSLDLVQQGLATFEDRYPVFEIMGEMDAIVSHHWHNAQNYLYYEALWGGFPLIHNSDQLDGCGYRYRSFDTEDGALALLEALRTHDASLEAYRSRGRQLLAKLDPLSDANVAAYTATLAEIVA